MKTLIIAIGCLVLSGIVSGQVYTEKKTRHRFAQLNIGLDYQSSFGGTTFFLNGQDFSEELSLPPIHKPRFIIGGTHFWGHADFYIAIPLANPVIHEQNQDIAFSSGVETVFKYYPWRIEHGKVRPYVGVSLLPYSFQQDNNDETLSSGPEVSKARFPIHTGVTFNYKNHLLELGLSYNFANSSNYYLSRTDQRVIDTPPLYASLSYRFMFETTLWREKEWESGRTHEVTKELAAAGKLDGIFVGVGLSSVWWLRQSTYNKEIRPYIPKYGNTIFPELSIGYHWNNPDINLMINYRGYETAAIVYGVSQKVMRKSLGLEFTKHLFDYNGFVPFIGAIITYENLSFEEQFETQPAVSVQDEIFGYGISLGWDIRPDRLEWFTVRTALRVFPSLKIDGPASVSSASINFENVEFNFIQFIVYPNRI